MDTLLTSLATTAEVSSPQMAFSGVGVQIQPNILAMEAAIEQMTERVGGLNEDFRAVADQAVTNAQATIAEYRQILAAGESGDSATVQQCSTDISNLRKENQQLIRQWADILRVL